MLKINEEIMAALKGGREDFVEPTDEQKEAALDRVPGAGNVRSLYAGEVFTIEKDKKGNVIYDFDTFNGRAYAVIAGRVDGVLKLISVNSFFKRTAEHKYANPTLKEKWGSMTTQEVLDELKSSNTITCKDRVEGERAGSYVAVYDIA